MIGVLDEAVRRKLLVVNPAREKGLRLKEQRPRGNVLEIDELEDLLAAAAEIDQTVTPKVLERGATARALRDQGVGVEGDRSAPGRGRGHGDLLHPAARAPADQRTANDHRLPRRCRAA